jgi:hypothetical protein
MVCYARPVGRFAVLLVGVVLIFGRPASHFLGTAAFLAAATVATGGAAIAAALTFATFMSARHRRAAAGGCMTCQFRCQHAMTGPSRRPWLVSRANRAEPPRTPARHPSPPSHPGPVLLSVPPVPSAAGPAASAIPAGPAASAGPAPRWPHHPLHRASGQPA